MKLLRCLRVLVYAALVIATWNAAQAQWTETDVQGFLGYNGEFVTGSPIQASDGNFYGASLLGGGGTQGEHVGVIYQVSAAGNISAFYAFCNLANCADGSGPNNRLIQGPDGALYGTTQVGGAYNCGVVFRLTLSGSYSVIHSFCSASESADGSMPLAGLTLAANGTFYGTTSTGGAHGDGVIFSMTAAGVETPLYSFCSLAQCQDGSSPMTNLIQGTDGILYGATSASGANGFGTLFSYNTTGQGTFNVIQAFCSYECVTGALPNNDLVIAANGELYGTTALYNINQTGGLVYAVTPGKESAPASYTVFYNFCQSGSSCLDGLAPKDGLFLASDGNMYGTTYEGGPTGGEGNAFELTTGGTETSIYDFQQNGTDGNRPQSTFIQGSDGSLYAPTYDGGSYEGTSGIGEWVRLTRSPALAGPVDLSASNDIVELGSPLTLSWSASNAYSLTMQQCYAFPSGGSGSGVSSGKVPASGSATITPAAAGVYSYAITCGGIESSSVLVSVTNGTKANTATTLSAPQYVTQYGSVTLSATVARIVSSGSPGGAVTFYADSVAIGSANVNSSGVATLKATAPGNYPLGQYSLVAKYNGDANDSGSTSSAASVDMIPNTLETLTASPTSVTPPGQVTLTATVSSAAGTPNGTVTFSVPHVATLATVQLNSSGVATVTASTSGVPAGQYNVLALYNGASGYSMTGAEVQVTVK